MQRNQTKIFYHNNPTQDVDSIWQLLNFNNFNLEFQKNVSFSNLVYFIKKM